MKTQRIGYISLLLIFLFSIGFSLNAQEAKADKPKDTRNTLFQHLYTGEDYVPTIKLHTAVKELFKNKSVSEEYYIPGNLTISQKDGEDMALTTKVKIRGNTRKKVCDNAPLKLNLVGSELDALGINKDIDKLKLVLQCDGSKSSFQQLLKEKAIYDLYGAIDPNAMQVQLIKLELYEDGDLKKELDAYIVEDEECYAHRLDAQVIEAGRMNYGALPRDQYFKLCFFQYMIANCDWSIANKHNIELVKLPDAKRLIGIPYDFDYAGFVNNRYAVPPDIFPISSVTERYFMIKAKMTPEDISDVIQYYQSKEQEFYAVIDGQKFMDDRTKKSSKSFLGSFYKALTNEKRITKNIASGMK